MFDTGQAGTMQAGKTGSARHAHTQLLLPSDQMRGCNLRQGAQADKPLVGYTAQSTDIASKRLPDIPFNRALHTTSEILAMHRQCKSPTK
jgi:hypothetical protein